MSRAEDLNLLIQAGNPAAHRCLTDYGRRLFYPIGIPAQSEEAKNARINATIGQFTDGRGKALTLPGLSDHLQGIAPESAFLYSPTDGQKTLRKAWQERLAARAAGNLSLPVVTGGITHGLSVIGDMFVDANTDVLLPDPGWGNYQHVFGTRSGGRLVPYAVLTPEGFDIDGLVRALDQVRERAVVILNFPGNPVGYTPTSAEVEQLVAALAACDKPLVVVSDDAYQDMLWEPGLHPHSLFYDIAALDPERVLSVKLDGATKELAFFGGRVGFITFGASGATAEALEEKARGSIRWTVSSCSSIAQALVLAGLRDPDLQAQRDALYAELERRYRVLKALATESSLPVWSFNSGCFVLVSVPGDAEQLRHTLLNEESVGVISFPGTGAIRVAYCSTHIDDLPELVAAINRRIR